MMQIQRLPSLDIKEDEKSYLNRKEKKINFNFLKIDLLE